LLSVATKSLLPRRAPVFRRWSKPLTVFAATPRRLPKVARARLVASVSAALSASSCASPGLGALALPLPQPSRVMVIAPALAATQGPRDRLDQKWVFLGLALEAPAPAGETDAKRCES
jgi:hypothetical protein